ncbi:MAG: helix-turn-helix transcriptional regulator [Deltaproteobacteria bacterium]|nr:helix-turn-helix transcriptional regulator [Deltaproteobacteria bacterium]
MSFTGEEVLPPPGKAFRRALGLTKTEAEVAWLMGHALSIAETSRTLGVSIHTVRAHLRQIYAKVGVRRHAQLVRLVLEQRASPHGVKP